MPDIHIRNLCLLGNGIKELMICDVVTKCTEISAFWLTKPLIARKGDETPKTPSAAWTLRKRLGRNSYKDNPRDGVEFVCASTNGALALEDAQLTGMGISWDRAETKENGRCLSLRSGKVYKAQRKDKIESSVISGPVAPEALARHAFGDMTTQGVSWELPRAAGGEVGRAKQGTDWLSSPCIPWWCRQPATLGHTYTLVLW